MTAHMFADSSIRLCYRGKA